MKFGSQRSKAKETDFSALYERHAREVWAVVYARTLNADTALDIAQEAFLRLWKQWCSGVSIRNARAWLIRVARNLAEDHAKSAFRRNGTHDPQIMNGVHSTASPPEARLLRDEEFARLRAALEGLTPSDREILTLRYALNYETDRIADAMGINSAAVHMRLSRARQRVADKLKEKGSKSENEEP